MKYKNSEQMAGESDQFMEEINMMLIVLKPSNILRVHEFVVIQDKILELATKNATNGGRFWSKVTSGFKGGTPTGSVCHEDHTQVTQKSFF